MLESMFVPGVGMFESTLALSMSLIQVPISMIFELRASFPVLMPIFAEVVKL